MTKIVNFLEAASARSSGCLEAALRSRLPQLGGIDEVYALALGAQQLDEAADGETERRRIVAGMYPDEGALGCVLAVKVELHLVRRVVE